MGALMTMGVRPKEIFLQYMAKGESNSRGRDLNIHIVNLPEEGRAEPVVVGPISMLGDSIPVAAGIAMGARMSRSTGSGQAHSTGSGQAHSTGSGQARSTGSGQAVRLAAMTTITRTVLNLHELITRN
jgi:TPP-dependent pyruvate/acetoin dehydrogenase alpha subunit